MVSFCTSRSRVSSLLDLHLNPLPHNPHSRLPEVRPKSSNSSPSDLIIYSQLPLPSPPLWSSHPPPPSPDWSFTHFPCHLTHVPKVASLASISQIFSLKCAFCHTVATDLSACGACKAPSFMELGNTIQVPYYCTAVCQREHWPLHKLTCYSTRLADQQMLCRVAETAQMLFYVYRELCWCGELEAVEKYGQDLHLVGECRDGLSWPQDYRTFPSDLVPIKEDREAVLSYRACKDATLFMLEFLADILADIITETEIIELWTKNDKRRITEAPEPQTKWHVYSELRRDPVIHEILKVTLRSGDVFVIDISGAQHGYHQPVWAWPNYETTRISSIKQTFAPPRTKELICTNDYSLAAMRANLEKLRLPSTSRAAALQQTLLLMNGHILEWQSDKKLPLVALWRFPEGRFRVLRDDLVEYAEWMFHVTKMVRMHCGTANGRRLVQEIPGPWDIGVWRKKRRELRGF